MNVPGGLRERAGCVQLTHGIAQVAVTYEFIPLEDRARLVTGHLHGYALGAWSRAYFLGGGVDSVLSASAVQA